MKQYAKTSSMPVGNNVLIRPRVDAILEHMLQGNVAVISAGAGFGKTTAISSFLQRSDSRCVWQQLTLLDNLPMRFWESFVHTVSLHRPNLAEELLKLGFPDSLFSFHKFLQLFTEELYSDNQFVVFVFDDFGRIKDESVLNFFNYLIASNLENICLVFTTRNTEDEMFLGVSHILTTEDLRFTREETREYFEMLEIEIDKDLGLDSIYEYTKGWPISLYLIGLQAKKSGMNFDKQLFDSQQLIFKLMEKEIFANYNDDEQRFFILLSFLNSFPEELLTEALGQSNATSLLRENAFVSYDSGSKSYYLHQIFMDFLAEKKSLVCKSDIDETLKKAGDWCYGHNFYVDAITYYEKCGAEDKIIEVIQGFKGARHSRSDANLFLKYIENFSEEFMSQNIMCRIVYAMMFLNSLEIDKALEQIKIVREQLDLRDETPENQKLKGEAFIGTGLIDLSLGNTELVELFRKASELLPNGSGHWGVNLRWIEYSNVLHITDAKKGAIEKYAEKICEAVPYIAKVLHGVGYGADCLAKAEESFFRGDFKTAETEAYKALFKAEEKNLFDVMDNALFLLLRIFITTGDSENVERMISRLEENKKSDGNRLYCVPDVAIGWYFAEVGAIEKVEDWIVYNSEIGRPPISIDKDLILQVKCLIEQKEYAKALAVSEKLQGILEKRNLLISLSYVFVLKAVILYNLYELDACAEALKKSYDITFENNITMPFVEFGHKTRSMLGFYKEQGIEGIPGEWFSEIHTKASTYAKRRAYLVSKYNEKTKEIKIDFGLTQREIELLKNMSQGLTRDEIASSMFISPNTVKSMLKTVYNKMGAVNGSDAVRIAGAAGIGL